VTGDPGSLGGSPQGRRPPGLRFVATPRQGRRIAAANRFDVYVVTLLRAAIAEIRTVARAGTPTHARLRDILMTILVATLGIDLVCALLIFLLERHIPGTQIHSFGSALFWTSTQLLTVSSQLPNPLSVGGRILDVAMQAYAITVVAALAGSMGAFLIRRARETDERGDGGSGPLRR
jgi:hypothetical protein